MDVYHVPNLWEFLITIKETEASQLAASLQTHETQKTVTNFLLSARLFKLIAWREHPVIYLSNELI